MESKSFANTRQSPRYKFLNSDECSVRLSGSDNSKIREITPLNLSPTGIAFVDNAELVPGSVILLEIAPFGSPAIKCQATIVRKSNNEYGAQFVGIPLLHQERLLQLIRTAEFSQKIDTYVQDRHFALKLKPKNVATALFWIATVATLMFAQHQWLTRF